MFKYPSLKLFSKVGVDLKIKLLNFIFLVIIGFVIDVMLPKVLEIKFPVNVTGILLIIYFFHNINFLKEILSYLKRKKDDKS